MSEVQLTDKVSYFDYVFQDHAIDHSGVLSPAISLDPQYKNSPVELWKALNSLEKYQSTSIVAYRAIAWWATRFNWRKRAWFEEEIVKRANEICDARLKPKTFSTYAAMQCNVE